MKLTINKYVLSGVALIFFITFTGIAQAATSQPALKVGATAGGDLTGTYPNPTIGNEKVTSGQIANGAVIGAKIGDGAVTFLKIAAGPASAGQFLTTDGAEGLSWTNPPPGEAIAALALGAQILTADFEDIAVIDQPPQGQYVIIANLSAGSAAHGIVECLLSDGPIDIGSTFANIPEPPPGLDAAGISLSLLAFRENPTNIRLQCRNSPGSTSPATVVGTRLVAIKVGFTFQ